MTWNLLGNPVVLAGVDAGTGDAPSFYLDTWDGFPDARVRLIGQLAGADNPVVLTGDYHAGMVLDVHERPFEDTPVVCTELMAPPISSPLFPADVSARTPQLRQQLNAHGYLAVDGRARAPHRPLRGARRRDRPRHRDHAPPPPGTITPGDPERSSADLSGTWSPHMR